MTISNISIRDPKESDIPTLLEIRNNQALQVLLLARYRPNDRKAVKAWIERRQSRETEKFFTIAGNDDQCLGFVQLVDIDRLNKKAYLGMCVHPDFQGKGVGKKALELLHKYAIEDCCITKIILEVKTTNTAAIDLYKKLNYKIVGIMKEHYILSGKLHDTTLMECIIGER